MFLVKLGSRVNAANQSKDQRQLSFRIATVLLCGTPCISTILCVFDIVIKQIF